MPPVYVFAVFIYCTFKWVLENQVGTTPHSI